MGLVTAIWLWRNTDVAPTVFLVGLAVSVMGWLVFLGARIAFRSWEMRMRVIWVLGSCRGQDCVCGNGSDSEFLLRLVGAPSRRPKPEEKQG